jgi:hypothetical protein
LCICSDGSGRYEARWKLNDVKDDRFSTCKDWLNEQRGAPQRRTGGRRSLQTISHIDFYERLSALTDTVSLLAVVAKDGTLAGLFEAGLRAAFLRKPRRMAARGRQKENERRPLYEHASLA